MEWMPDPVKDDSNSPGLVFSSSDVEKFEVFASKFKSKKVEFSAVSHTNLEKYLEEHQVKVIVFDASEKLLHDQIQLSQHLQSTFPEINWVLSADGFSISNLETILNSSDFYAVFCEDGKFLQTLEKAIESQGERKDYYDTLKKVKVQNKKLEELNKNLEGIVHERTMKEFVASNKTSRSLKTIRGLLSFIKSMSRVSNADEFMVELQRELKKISGIMPPLLVLQEGKHSLRLFYFQGRQLIEKKVSRSQVVGDLSAQNPSDLRSSMTNFLGRPMGAIEIEKMQFQAKELLNFEAFVVFENNFGDKIVSEYIDFMKDRWPIINMALENILIKEGMHNIARQWSRTFNEMKDPIAIMDSNYKLSLSNTAYNSSEDKKYLNDFSGLESSFKEDPVQVALATGETYSTDIHIKDKVYRVNSYPIHLDGQSQPSHVINQYADVTQSIDLQSRVIQGEKMAAVGLLAGNIAHELNNPLTGIHSLAELLLDDFENESNTYKDMDEIRMAAARCQRIIKDLLDFSDLETNARVSEVEVNGLVRKTLPLLKMAMRMMNSNLNLSEGELWVECNPQLLQQVVFNLINNACQAMEETGVLTVITKQQGDEVSIIIRDTGSGIPDEIKESVFDPFFTTKSEGKGTGLGLSMSKSVIERAGGRLQLNHSSSDGTEFEVVLPKAKK